MKIYTNNYEERIYSTGNSELDKLLERAFCDGYEYAQREFTKYDETDNLKRAKDSDILAEKEKEGEGYGEVVNKGLKGALVGGAGSAAVAALAGLAASKGKKTLNVKDLGKIAAAGAGIGGLLGANNAAKKRNKKQEEIDFYNKRLRYAKRQAKRRESKDWKSNMTQREGYSY